MTEQLRILLVDDDEPFCAALQAALVRRGHEVRTAHDTAVGKREVSAFQPDVAIVDLKMPGEGGLELVRHLGECFAEVICIVLTGYGSIATAVQATKLGATQYLTKPVSVDEILRAVSGLPQEAQELRSSSLDEVEWEHLQRVLVECGGNISEAARRLQMHRRTLQRKLARGR